MGQEGVEVAEQVGCLDAVGETLNIVGTAELRQGNLGGLEKLDHSREIAQQTGDEIGMARAYMHPTAALAGRREWVLAERYLGPGREFCREHGLHGFYGWLTTFAAESALAQGRWAEAVSAAAEILAWPVDGFGQLRVTALVVTATVRARRGESGYQALLDEAAVLAEAEPLTARAGAQIAALRAEAAWLAGAEPQQTGEAAWPAAAGPDVTRWFAGDVEVWRHRAGLDCGDPAELPEPYRMEISGDAARCGPLVAGARLCLRRGPCACLLGRAHPDAPRTGHAARRWRSACGCCRGTAVARARGAGPAPRPPVGHRGEPGGPHQPRGGSADATGRAAGQPADRRAARRVRPCPSTIT